MSTVVSSLDRELDARACARVAPARTRWWIEVLVVVWLAWVYDAINNLAPLRLGPALATAARS